MARPYHRARLCCGIWARQTSRFLRIPLHGMRVQPRRAFGLAAVAVLFVIATLGVASATRFNSGPGGADPAQPDGHPAASVAESTASPDIQVAIPPDFSPIVQLPATPTPAAPSPTASADTPTADQQARSERVRQLMAGTPLAGYSVEMVLVSDRYGIDWRLLPVIAVLESGGGANACGGNAWGFAACRVLFGSLGEGIRVVASTLASPPYAGRPPSLVLCIWVAGSGCNNRQAVEYVQRAAPLYWRLGGSLAVPALPAEAQPVTPEPAGIAAAESADTEAVPPTPTATQTTSPPMTSTRTVPASPTPARAPGTPTAEATKATSGAGVASPTATAESTAGAG